MTEVQQRMAAQADQLSRDRREFEQMRIAVARPRRTYVYRERSDHTGSLIKALAAAQGEFHTVVKDTKGQYGWFATLAAMRKATAHALAKYGLAVHFEYADIDDVPYLVCVLGHESDQWVSSVIRMERIADPQKKSAYMTYMKRAAYSAILCLASEEDDDGETASAASAEAAAAVWNEQWRLAQDAIKSATTTARVDAIVNKAIDKVEAGQMDPAVVKQLDALARARRKALSESASPQEAAK